MQVKAYYVYNNDLNITVIELELFRFKKHTPMQFNILRMVWRATLTFVAVNSHYISIFYLYNAKYTCDKAK